MSANHTKQNIKKVHTAKGDFYFENCGSTCGTVDGYLCPNCTGWGVVVPPPKSDEEEND